MKKMKRLVAVLLAGIMALAMLTACGSKSLGQQYEDLMMEALNLSLKKQGMQEVKNDPELRAELYEILGHIDPATGEYEEGYELPADIREENYSKIYSVAGPNNRPVEVTQDTVDAMKKALENNKTAQQDAEPKVETKAGIATRVVGGKTYTANVVERTTTYPDVAQ